MVTLFRRSLVIVLTFLAADLIASDETACASRPDVDVFAAMVATGVQIQCNATGHWEVEFEEMLAFVFVPAGDFTMGANDGLAIEAPAHEVFLSGYWVGKYPVTVGQFREFVASSGYISDAERGWGAWQWTGLKIDTPDSDRDAWELRRDGRWNNIFFSQGDDHPVGSVSWNDANHYAKWLSQKLGVPLVLPSEAQWEKSARGTDSRLFPWGNSASLIDRVNFADKSFASKYGNYARRPDLELDDEYVETSPVDAFQEGQSPWRAMASMT